MKKNKRIMPKNKKSETMKQKGLQWKKNPEHQLKDYREP